MTSPPGGNNPPIPPTVPLPASSSQSQSGGSPGGMGPIPKTISLQDYQSALSGKGGGAASGKPGGRVNVKNMAANIDEREKQGPAK